MLTRTEHVCLLCGWTHFTQVNDSIFAHTIYAVLSNAKSTINIRLSPNSCAVFTHKFHIPFIGLETHHITFVYTII